MLLRPKDRAAARFLADRGRFPSGGAVPYDVAHRAIQNALDSNASRLAALEEAVKAIPDRANFENDHVFANAIVAWREEMLSPANSTSPSVP